MLINPYFVTRHKVMYKIYREDRLGYGYCRDWAGVGRTLGVGLGTIIEGADGFTIAFTADDLGHAL